MSSTPVPCLCIGLKAPGAKYASDGQIDSRVDPAKGHLEKQLEQAASKNLGLEFLLVDLTNKPADDALAELKRRLGEKKYAAVTIGFGVRGEREYTEAFEKLVNACVEANQGLKFGFANWPDDVVSSLERALGRS